MNAILHIKDLTKHYPGFTLDHVSFDIPKGCIMGLIGENGAGKSTTINAVLGLIHKDEGEVTFWGEELNDESSSIKENIGVVFDETNFYDTLTVSQIGNISAAAYKQWQPEKFDSYLRKFDLGPRQGCKISVQGHEDEAYYCRRSVSRPETADTR